MESTFDINLHVIRHIETLNSYIVVHDEMGYVEVNGAVVSLIVYHCFPKPLYSFVVLH